jgi:hypothetical protein
MCRNRSEYYFRAEKNSFLIVTDDFGYETTALNTIKFTV